MERNVRVKIYALFLLSLLIFLHLIPLSLHPNDALYDTRDCFLNCWIISWVQQNVFSNPLDLFNANIFYPHINSLSFSEHLFPQSIFSLPVYYLSKNPVLVYNFVFFLSFLLNAYAMFLLIKHLTKNDIAAIICGIIFSLNTYQINQISHLQLLSSGFIPLSFLYFHRFIEKKCIMDSFLFSLFFTLQALACVYYGLFFISILVLVFPIILILYHKEINFSFLAKLFSPLIISGVVIIILYLPYFSLIKTQKLDRGLLKGADLTNYLAVDPHNIFLGKLLTSLGSHEHFLFPGIIAFFFAGLFLLQNRRILKINSKIIRISTLVFIIINLVIIVLNVLTGGFNLKLGFLIISVHNLAKPAMYIMVLGLLYAIASITVFIFRKKGAFLEDNKNLILYFSLVVWSLLLSFGGAITFMGDSTSTGPLPFKLFYALGVGFEGIRVPSRYAVFVIFSITILAGYGLKYFFQKMNKKKVSIFFTAVLIIILNLEYLSIPQRMRLVPVKNDIPPTYQYLKRIPGDFAIMELPFFHMPSDEAIYMYFSLFHGKKIVNGWSGYLPPSSFYIKDMFNTFPSLACADILKSLNVKFIVIHKKIWKERTAQRKLLRIEEKFKNDLKLVKEFKYKFGKDYEISEFFGDDLIYEVALHEEEKIPDSFQEVSPKAWTVKASMNEELLRLMKDNNPATEWSTGEQKKTGDFILVEFNEPVRLAKASLHLGRFPLNYALNIKAETSIDGKKWKNIRKPYSPGEFTQNLIHSPLTPIQNIYLRDRKLRYLKIIQVGNSKDTCWSIAELKIYH